MVFVSLSDKALPRGGCQLSVLHYLVVAEWVSGRVLKREDREGTEGGQGRDGGRTGEGRREDRGGTEGGQGRDGGDVVCI